MTPPAGNWDLFVADGRGQAYGAEFDVSYKGRTLNFDGSYTLSWNRRKFDELYSGWFYDKFDNRHRINLTLSCKLSKKSEIYAAWTCHTGDRFTVPTQFIEAPAVPGGNTNPYASMLTVYEKPNNLVLPLYHRLDIGFNFHHTTKHGHERIWNISIYNAYCRMNTLYAEVNVSDNGRVRLRKYGVIPILPSFSYTIKF